MMGKMVQLRSSVLYSDCMQYVRQHFTPGTTL